MRWYVLLAIVLGIAGVTIYALLFTVLFSGVPIFTSPTPYVAVIKLRGTITYTRPLFPPSEAIVPDDVNMLVNQVINDPMAKAVVIVINSPGGSASASEEIYEVISELSKRKVVVAYCEDVMASGGYYIALPSKKIVASPHCIVGSIGAIAIFYDVHKLLNKLGINVTIVKSGEFKDIGSMFRPLNSKEVAMIKRIVNEAANTFKERVLSNRVNVSEDVFNAGIYSARDALRLGLVDYVGTFKDAIALAKKLSGLPPTAPTRIITKPKSFIETLLGLSERVAHSSYSLPIYLNPGIYYLWLPGLNYESSLGFTWGHP